jgi:hypothetical protein
MVYAMIAVTAVAYAVGAVLRFNIANTEPVLGKPDYALATSLDHLADAAIILAYVISVTLYLHILSAFLLTGIGADTAIGEDVVTSGIIVLIVLIGMVRGLEVLNFLEQWALYVTLAIVALVLLGFTLYDAVAFRSPAGLVLPTGPVADWWTALTIVAGALIVVQGFETPRYLGGSYSTADRVWGSRMSQVISSVVYVTFVTLALPMVHELDGVYDDDSLLTLVSFTVVPFLAGIVVVAAVLSQFAAAVADTVAVEGNVAEVTNHRASVRLTYAAIGIAAIALTWSANTFEILALASRAFAVYYFLQCVVAMLVTTSILQKIAMSVLASIMLFIVIFAVPVA